MSAVAVHVLAGVLYLALVVALIVAIAFGAKLWRAREQGRMAFADLRKAYRARLRRIQIQKRRKRERAEVETSESRVREALRDVLRDGPPEQQATLESTIRPPPLCDWSDDELETEHLPDWDSRATQVMPRRKPRPPDD